MTPVLDPLSAGPASEARAPGGGAPPGVRLLPLLVLAAVLALAGFAGTLRTWFLQDDFVYLHNAASEPTWFQAWWLTPRWDEDWFRPLSVSSWWLEHRLWGLEPLGYRLTNLGAHVLAAALLGLLVARLARDRLAAWLATALFAVHPVHPEAVTWISARFDPFCACAMLLCLLAWTRFLEPAGRARHLLGACAALVLAAACKETGLGAVGCAAVLLLARPGRPPRRAWGGLAALLAAAAAWILVRATQVDGLGATRVVAARPELTEQPALWRVGRFLGQSAVALFVPSDSAAVPDGWGWLARLPGWLLLAVLVAALALSGRRAPWRPLLVLLAMLLGMLLPLSAWGRIGPAGEDHRFLYIPSLFAVGLLAVGVACLARARPAALRGAALAAAGVALAGWLLLLVQVNRKWIEASHQSEAALAALPGELTRTHVIVLGGLPPRRRGVPLWMGAITVAADLVRALPADRMRQLSEDGWHKALESSRQQERPGVAFLWWDEARGSWSEIWRGAALEAPTVDR